MNLKDLKITADALGISDQDVAEMIGLSRMTFARRRRMGGVLSQSESDRLDSLRAVVDSIVNKFAQDQDAARHWFLTPNLLLDNERPVDHLQTEIGRIKLSKVARTLQNSMAGVPKIDQITGVTMDDSSDIPTVDFGIIAALPLELDACLRHFGTVSKVTFEQSDTRTYYRGTVSTADNGLYQIVATLLPRMGNVEAALATNDLMHLWRPRYVLMVGIAGGVSRSSQALGDVVISERIFYYESGKIAKRVEARPRVLPADALLYDRALNLRLPHWYDAIPRDVQRPGQLKRSPSLHFGPIASGEKVIADIRAVEYLRTLQPKLAAIEMEGAGVAAAALGAVRHVGFLVIRGLCDFADASKGDTWQSYAANSAATFAFQLLKSAPIAPRSQAVQANEQRAVALQPPSLDRAALFRRITTALDMEGFKTLCFLLSVDVDEIPGEKKSSKVRELILIFERRGNLDLVNKTFADMREA